MVSVAHDTSRDATDRDPVRVLGVFAHPDDETLCAGGTFAKYASAGADVRVVSLTKGGAGQIRDANAATRSTLTTVREQELGRPGPSASVCRARGAWTTPTAACPRSTGRCWSPSRQSCCTRSTPTWSSRSEPDGFSGHPDHVAVGAAVTRACYERWDTRPVRLFHCYMPRSRLLLRDRLAKWVVDLTTRFTGTQDFVRALSVFSRETTALGYAADFVRVDWFPSGSYLLEQGEPATAMYFLLSGQVEIRRESEDGRIAVVDRSGPGEFVGEVGIATGRPRNAHVVAVDDVTSLTFLATPDPFEGRGEQVQPELTRSLPSGDRIDPRVSACIDVGDFVGHKIRATAAHRSQYPIDPEMFPEHILREMFGAEYFIQVLPERRLDSSLLEE